LAVGLLLSCGLMLKVLPHAWGLPGAAGNAFITLVWMAGITNAMNFFDGMDGLAAGLGAILAFFLGVLAFQTVHPHLGWVAVAMLGACLGFLPHNFRVKKRARIFLGDAGSNFIGFVLAGLAVWGEWADNPMRSLLPPLLIFFILIFDLLHISVDRVVTGKVRTVRQWLEYVGTDHLHHRIAAVLGGKGRTVLFIYVLAVCLGASAMIIRTASTTNALLVLLQAGIIVALVTVLERRGRRALRREEELVHRAREN
ncbi:MAG: undecaprenyl/decaprenyl-phosphate alpha-N-acetylglucosaminyl 1-phosphate transferase, partial [Deltaproteobacteria bacterium]|nr:undecaprenyl/decaprenyl-phosphate alpha-N-acetylglucosaminyl 1-phosphate transferase [Deltaproteobacteria bacterium]